MTETAAWHDESLRPSGRIGEGSGRRIKKRRRAVQRARFHLGSLGGALGFPANRACSPPLHLVPLSVRVPLTVLAYSLTNASLYAVKTPSNDPLTDRRLRLIELPARRSRLCRTRGDTTGAPGPSGSWHHVH